MSVKIRMTRTGSKNAACFRIVATDGRAPRDGRFIEILGWYDPKIDGPNFRLKLDRVEHWTNQGALMSDSVSSLMRRARKGEMAEGQTAPAEEAEVVAVEEVAVEEVDSAEVVEEDATPEEEPAEKSE